MEPLLPSPLQSTTATNFKSILRLCQDAYRFAVFLRRSSADFECEIVPDGTVIDEKVESEISVQAFDPPQTPQTPQAPVIQGSKIVLTVFGALVKIGPATGERHVLEKSHVVCRE